MMNTTSVDRATKKNGRARRDDARVGAKSVLALVDQVFEDDLHARTVLSLSTGVLGALCSSSPRQPYSLLGSEWLVLFAVCDSGSIPRATGGSSVR